MTLRDRFEAFVQTLDGFENIDALLREHDPQNMKRADYLLTRREIVIEQKSLEIDPAAKPQQYIDKLVREGRLLFYGQLSTKVLFSKHPEGQKFQRQLILKIGEVIADNVAHADKQTRDTRKVFSIPNSVGILVLLNEDAATLTPDIVHYALAQEFQKKNQDGALRYPHNDGVLLISEAHPIAVSGYAQAFPIMSFVAPKSQDRRDASDALAMLQTRWAAFNGMPLIRPFG